MTTKCSHPISRLMKSFDYPGNLYCRDCEKRFEYIVDEEEWVEFVPKEKCSCVCHGDSGITNHIASGCSCHKTEEKPYVKVIGDNCYCHRCGERLDYLDYCLTPSCIEIRVLEERNGKPETKQECSHRNLDGDKHYVDKSGKCVDCCDQDPSVIMKSHTSRQKTESCDHTAYCDQCVSPIDVYTKSEINHRINVMFDECNKEEREWRKALLDVLELKKPSCFNKHTTSYILHRLSELHAKFL